MLDEVTWLAWLDFLETRNIASRALLRDPATESDFAAVVALIGRPLPAAFRALYRFSNGQLRSRREGRKLTALFGAGYEFLALADVAEAWRVWKAVADQSGKEGMADHAE